MRQGLWTGRARKLIALSVRMAAFVYFAVIVASCATPIGVDYVEPRAAYHSLTANVLSAEKPSSFSARQLINLNLYQRFEDEPEKALAEMHSGLASKGDEDRVFALAELSFVHAQNSGERTYYLASAVYAYAFLLPGEHGTAPKGIDPRFRLAADLYNQALTRAAMLDDREYPVPRGGTFRLPFGEITVEFDEAELIWEGFRLKDFVPATDVQVRGLRNRYRLPGIGAPLAASLEPMKAATNKQYARIAPSMRIPATAFLRLNDPRAALNSGKLSGKLEFYTPDATRSLEIEGVAVPIEYETTSALALSLEGAPIWDFEIAGFRSGDFAIGAQKFMREGLFMVRPHRAERVPVILVHGTASSPARWAELVNELENDPRFWESYEIWFFMYNTGNPIADSAARLRAALSSVVADLDPNGEDSGLKQMVVIGHSQGGLLAKMCVIDSGTRFWDGAFKVPPDELDVRAETRQWLKHALLVKPLPFVRRVVFIATPHRGSYQALGLLGGIASWLVKLPGNLTRLSVELATLQTRGLLAGPFSGIPTSITNMNPSNRFIQALASMPIADGVTAHSIIAVQGDGPPQDGADGIVMYKSAHIDGVASEKVVRSGHSVQGNPETIQEVKRILVQHNNHTRLGALQTEAEN